MEVKNLLKRKSEADAKTSAPGNKRAASQHSNNPFLRRPCNPEDAILGFLMQCRTSGKSYVGDNKTALEVEARIGCLKSPMGMRDMRVMSSGAKMVPVGDRKVLAQAFHCNASDVVKSSFVPGVTKSHFIRWTGSGLSEVSPLSLAFGVSGSKVVSSQLKKDIEEVETVETVFAGYTQGFRICYSGEEGSWKSCSKVVGKMEFKRMLENMDLALPSAAYDLRLMLATEKSNNENVPYPPPKGWTTKRIKRRRSYKRRDKSFAWRIDITEVTTASSNNDIEDNDERNVYEIEVELSSSNMQKLVLEKDDKAAQNLARQFTQQLWWILGQINPLSDVLDVESYLEANSSAEAVKAGLMQCSQLKAASTGESWLSAISESGGLTPTSYTKNMKFIGCMPVNFSRCNIEEIQRSERGYFISEKTDGVRYLMIFTGSSVVLFDRRMDAKQPVVAPSAKNEVLDPMSHVLPHVQPGTVLDGEVVIHRKYRRPIFIVFDVLCCGQTSLVHLPFSERLQVLKNASFCKKGVQFDIFNAEMLKNPAISLPLIRKNFVRRIELDNLLSHVIEEKGLRMYRNGDSHHHLTDGIIFQPNLPYVMGTDHNLLKWKYLDTGEPPIYRSFMSL